MINNALALIIGYGNPMIGFQENDRKTNTESETNAWEMIQKSQNNYTAL